MQPPSLPLPQNTGLSFPDLRIHHVTFYQEGIFKRDTVLSKPSCLPCYLAFFIFAILSS
jgi:hypothetical protein